MTTFKLKPKSSTLLEKFNSLFKHIQQYMCPHNQTSIDNGGVQFCIKCKKTLYKTTY